jgi:MoxR-like ATPase
MSTKAKSVSKIDTLTLKPSETQIVIRHMRPRKVSLFIWGPPGVAKSAITNQVATEDGEALIDIRLSQMEPTDLRGVPIPSNENGVPSLKWSAPTALPRDIRIKSTRNLENVEEVIYFNNPLGDNGIHHVQKVDITVKSLTKGATAKIVAQAQDNFTAVLLNDAGEPVEGKLHFTIDGKAKGILMLDEFNSAAPSVQAGAYQLILDRRLGEYVVPDGVMVMAAGNRENDKGITFRMPTPIANRFVHIEMRSDFDDWQKWALLAGIDSAVVGYLSAFKDDLHNFDAASASRGFATPRSWEFTSKITADVAPDGINDQIMLAMIAGAVGEGVAMKFHAFRKEASQLPSTDDILNGKAPQLATRDVSLHYALSTSLCYALRESLVNVERNGNKKEDKALWLQRADNFIGFMMKNFMPEVIVMGSKTALSTFKLPLNPKVMPNFGVFVEQYKKIIINN